ncbi:M28 family peptidase [Actinomycetes bacterium KLBMP 9759]
MTWGSSTAEGFAVALPRSAFALTGSSLRWWTGAVHAIEGERDVISELGNARRRRVGSAFVGMVVLLAVAACGTVVGQPASPGTAASGTAYAPLVQQLTDEVSETEAFTHLTALQKIADENGGNRAAGTRGYDASVEYVAGVLRTIGFEVGTPTYEASGDGDSGGSGQGRNVIAETRTGDAGQVVLIGAHLDSVQEGPGIVDNGSGVATLLEIATRLGPDPAVTNKVRFAFFGHEEVGLDGSTGYVESLSSADLEKIKLYLNVDMVASPNGGYIVQGGKGSDVEQTGPPGSGTIAQVLADRLIESGVRSPEITEFVGDDETAFVEAGIPAGGAENGDAKKKTAAQAEAWGGEAGQVYDPCYHKACDRIENVNRTVLGHYLKALAGTLAHFATSTEPLR